jgi:hypothetical protein
MCTHANQIITKPTCLSFAAIRICIPQCMCKLYACDPSNYQTDLHLVCGYPHLQPTLCNLHACGPYYYQTDLHVVCGYPRLHTTVLVQFACMRPILLPNRFACRLRVSAPASHSACAICMHATQVITKPICISSAAIRICSPQCLCNLHACDPGNYQTDLHLVCGYPHLQPTVLVQFACMRPN